MRRNNNHQHDRNIKWITLARNASAKSALLTLGDCVINGRWCYIIRSGRFVQSEILRFIRAGQFSFSFTKARDLGSSAASVVTANYCQWQSRLNEGSFVEAADMMTDGFHLKIGAPMDPFDPHRKLNTPKESSSGHKNLGILLIWSEKRIFLKEIEQRDLVVEDVLCAAVVPMQQNTTGYFLTQDQKESFRTGDPTFLFSFQILFCWAVVKLDPNKNPGGIVSRGETDAERRRRHRIVQFASAMKRISSQWAGLVSSAFLIVAPQVFGELFLMKIFPSKNGIA